VYICTRFPCQDIHTCKYKLYYVLFFIVHRYHVAGWIKDPQYLGHSSDIRHPLCILMILIQSRTCTMNNPKKNRFQSVPIAALRLYNIQRENLFFLISLYNIEQIQNTTQYRHGGNFYIKKQILINNNFNKTHIVKTQHSSLFIWKSSFPGRGLLLKVCTAIDRP